MNFNFGYSQRKFGFQPNVRQFSTIGVLPTRIDSLITKTGQYNVLNSPILSTKSFSNPNYVNKHNPNILASSLAGIVKFDRTPQNYCVHQPKCDKNDYKNETETNISTDIIPVESSQEEINMKIVNKMDEPNIIREQVKSNLKTSPKMSKRNKRKKRKSVKKKSTPDKHQSKNKKCGNRKKQKPWHKTNVDLEIMECSESTLDSDSSNMMDEPDKPFCITITTKSSPIDIKPNNLKLNIDKSDGSMSISPCHHEILKSLSISSLSKSDSISPCSPILRKLRMPSECDSEDSFIVFEDKSCESEEISSDDDSDFDEESETSDDSDCDVEFLENCDISGNQKKVSFKCDTELCEVHPMIKWGYAYHTARCGPWERIARDRARFEARIRRTEETLGKVLHPKHREYIYNTRFEGLEH